MKNNKKKTKSLAETPLKDSMSHPTGSGITMEGVLEFEKILKANMKDEAYQNWLVSVLNSNSPTNQTTQP